MKSIIFVINLILIMIAILLFTLFLISVVEMLYGGNQPSVDKGQKKECGDCMLNLTLPNPGFCKKGRIIYKYDECGCPMAPMCTCTLEARSCPDGSIVGRKLPDCEFAKCPVN